MNVKMMHRILALVMALVLFLMLPVRAYATGLETVVLGTAAVEAIKVLLPVIAALGVWAGIDSGFFESVANDCVNAMTELGHVVDGMIDVCISDGKSYVAEDLIQAVRDWLFETEVITEVQSSGSSVSASTKVNYMASHWYCCSVTTILHKATYTNSSGSEKVCFVSYAVGTSFTYTINSNGVTYDAGKTTIDGVTYYYTGTVFSLSLATETDLAGTFYLGSGYKDGSSDLYKAMLVASGAVVSPVTTINDLTLGRVSTPSDTDEELITKVWIEPVIVVEPNPNVPDPNDPEHKAKHFYPVSVKDKLNHLITQDEAQTGETDIEPETETDPDGGDSSGDGSGTDTMTGTISQVQANTFWEKLEAVITAAFEWLGNMLLEGIQSLFVPETDFLTAKVDAIRAEFSFADAIITTGEFFQDSFSGLGTEPPIIYIDLGATEGSYDIGGKVVFMDLSWYERYKDTGDALISSFLWIVFAWRMLHKVPSVIGGMPGDFVMQGVHMTGMSESLPSRKKEYEIQRQSNREFIRRRRE